MQPVLPQDLLDGRRAHGDSEAPQLLARSPEWVLMLELHDHRRDLRVERRPADAPRGPRPRRKIVTQRRIVSMDVCLTQLGVIVGLFGGKASWPLGRKLTSGPHHHDLRDQ